MSRMVNPKPMQNWQTGSMIALTGDQNLDIGKLRILSGILDWSDKSIGTGHVCPPSGGLDSSPQYWRETAGTRYEATRQQISTIR